MQLAPMEAPRECLSLDSLPSPLCLRMASGALGGARRRCNAYTPKNVRAHAHAQHLLLAPPHRRSSQRWLAALTLAVFAYGGGGGGAVYDEQFQ